MAPKFLYKLVYEQVDWPFRCNVRFLKPFGKFDLAVGFESWHHNASPNLELNPAETVFTVSGKILYSGLGITPGEQRKIEFLSQSKKQIVKKLPKNDPRYELACQFAAANHYFFEGEVPHPTRDGYIRATGLPFIGNEVFDGRLRAVRQMGDERGEAAVQFFGFLRVQFAPFGGQPGSFPYRRLVARQRGKRRELCGSVKHRHLRMVLRDVVRQVDDVVVGGHFTSSFAKHQ